MGVKINAQENPDSPFLVSMKMLATLLCQRIFRLWQHPDWLYRLCPQYSAHQRCIEVMQGFTDEVIKKKREEIKREELSKAEADHGFVYRRKNFLDLLISLSEAHKGYDDVELREEVLTLTVAGMDTSATAIGYIIKLLGKYPAIQEKVYQELYELYGDSEQPVVKEDLTKMKYLERVVKEALRLFPPVPFIIRKIEKDIELPSGRVLPAGSGVVCSIWGVHRDPKYWGPDVEEFNPDRFLPERFNLEHPCSYMPFSFGNRNCVGYQYALTSVKTALASMLRRYRVVDHEESGPVPHIRVKLEIMMKDIGEYEIALEKRKRTAVNGRSVYK